jgi:streptomycin 3"-adenylyltransferase
MNPSEILSVISREYQLILGENLCGIYVHGSLAFGCFNWNKK